MLKKYTPIILFIIGLLISLLLAYAAWDSGFLQTAEDKKIEEQLAADKKAAEEKATADKLAAEEKAAADAKAAEEEKTAAEQESAENQPVIDIEAIQSAMSFDVLRIEPSGDAVIAGLAPADSKVEIVNALTQNSVIAKATARDSGEFALVLDKPLNEGKHELYIQAWDQKENKYVSNEIALIEVFTASLNKIPVVIVSKAGAATRILQGEETKQVQAEVTEEAATTEAATTEAATTEAATTEAASTEEEVRTEVAALSEETTEETVAETVEVETQPAEVIPDPINAVFIKAADVENGNLIIAGVGPVDGVLNIYVDDQLLGQTTIAANNAFIFDKTYALEAGRHSIRADRINTATNKVLGRAEVTLVHEPQLAAAEEEAVTEEATTEEVVTEEAAAEEATTEEAVTEEAVTEETTTEETTATQEVASATQETVTEEVTTEVASATEETTSEVATTTEEETTTEVAETTEDESTEEASTEEATTTEEATEEATTETATATEEAATASEEKPTEEATTEEAATTEVASTTQETVTEETTTEVKEEAKEEIHTGTTVIIRRGDSLWRVSRKNYGEGVKFTTIFEANKDQIKDPNLIYPGQVFSIPE